MKKIDKNDKNNETKIRKNKSVLPIIILGIILIVLCTIAYFSFFSQASREKREFQNHIENAEKYLDDLEYEKAIAEYEAAIELNPMDGDVLDTYVDTVLDYAEIVAENDVEEAAEIIADAIKFLDDVADENRKIRKKIEILEEKREEYLALTNNESTAEYDIPDDAFEWNGHYYAIYNDADTWEEAKVLCEERNGHLATIMSETENYMVSEYVMSMGYYSIYFGCIDESMTGNWIWVTGEKLSYSNWHEGEPNSQDGTERYGMYYFGDDTWNDGTFVSDAYICEWDVGEEDPALLDDNDNGNSEVTGDEDNLFEGEYQDTDLSSVPDGFEEYFAYDFNCNSFDYISDIMLPASYKCQNIYSDALIDETSDDSHQSISTLDEERMDSILLDFFNLDYDMIDRIKTEVFPEYERYVSYENGNYVRYEGNVGGDMEEYEYIITSVQYNGKKYSFEYEMYMDSPWDDYHYVGIGSAIMEYKNIDGTYYWTIYENNRPSE